MRQTAVDGSSGLPAGGAVLEVRDLVVTYWGERGPVRALEGVSFTIGEGESLGLVGESGSGKSTVALAIMRYLPPNGRIAAGRVQFEGQDLLDLSVGALRRLRGRRLAMVYQDPSSALNPAMRVGDQVAEVYRTHARLAKSAARDAARAMLSRVHMRDPGSVMSRYPHQLSGGMQQRVVIAMALASNPSLLIMDEPTTGLDATVEAAVLDLVAELRAEFGAAILFISHNLAVVARLCDRIGVLYAGRLVELGATGEVFHAPRHPYTLGLLGSVPRFGVRKDSMRLMPIAGQVPQAGAPHQGCRFASRCALVRDRCHTAEPPLFEAGAGRFSRCYFWDALPPSAAAYIASMAGQVPLVGEPAQFEDTVYTGRDAQPVLTVDGLEKTFPGRHGQIVHAVDGVTLRVERGRTFGLVGESGSGKSTLARVIAGLLPASAGRITFDGGDITVLAERRTKGTLKRLQMVFQSPEATLNPQHRVGSILAHSVRALTDLRGAAVQDRVRALAGAVNLDPVLLERFPGQLSGGQRQRAAIARAFAGEPELVICDEPASALDVSVQAAILNLLVDIQEQSKASYIFISHDLTVVRYLADDIGVMYLGHLVEVGPAERVFAPPYHPYTELLFAAIPTLDLENSAPLPAVEKQLGAAEATNSSADQTPPSGCPFRFRCPRLLGPHCAEEPPWRPTANDHAIRCWIPVDTLAQAQDSSSVGRENSARPPGGS